ncbi:MAG: glycosyltransferase family 4 protein [Spirochaetales bacterium]|nr:glycosyltransferase family 4 protein [Spirochaetales bacterium]
MNILYINKFYPFTHSGNVVTDASRFYPTGGTETLLFTLDRMFHSRGHNTLFFSMKHPDNIKAPYSDYFASYINLHETGGIMESVMKTVRLLYSRSTRRKLGRLLDDYHVDIAHIHNIAHQLSPSVMYELRKRRIPVVMTLLDYKLVCPAYQLISRGRFCDACKKKRYFNCVLKKCHKDSYLKSFIVMLENYLHTAILPSYSSVSAFICPSHFMMEKIQEMGFKGTFIYIPNFINPYDFEPRTSWEEASIVYFGRLSWEKGLATLIKAVKDIKGVTLKIIGTGPFEGHVKSLIETYRVSNIRFLGFLDSETLYNEIRKSMFFILPSECHENNPFVLLEGFALGKCVVASRIGGIQDFCHDSYTGLTFTPGDDVDLRRKIEYLCGHQEKIVEMGNNARAFIEETFNADRYYNRLLDIYVSAAKENRTRTARISHGKDVPAD